MVHSLRRRKHNRHRFTIIIQNSTCVQVGETVLHVSKILFSTRSFLTFTDRLSLLPPIRAPLVHRPRNRRTRHTPPPLLAPEISDRHSGRQCRPDQDDRHLCDMPADAKHGHRLGAYQIGHAAALNERYHHCRHRGAHRTGSIALGQIAIERNRPPAWKELLVWRHVEARVRAGEDPLIAVMSR
jgi:hypothetical protein